MKSITSLFRRFGFIASVLLLTSGPDSQAQTNLVPIPDPELQSVIRAALNKPTGDITVADMENLTVLDASSATRGEERPAITSLEGLEAARNLRTLNFESGIWWMNSPDPTVLATTNLAVISTLSKLENLDISFYHRAALANPSLPFVLSSLTNLLSLTLVCTPLADSSFLTNLTRLRSLNLDDTGLTNMPPLAGLMNLEFLWLNDNWLVHVSIPSGLGNLRELQLSQTGLRSLTLPDDLTHLHTLALWNNPLTNLTLPASVDLSALTLLGFPKSEVTIGGLWLRQPGLEDGGRVRLRISGAAGRTVQVERSTNLVAWTPWQTVVLGQNGGELSDDVSPGGVQFYRVR